MDGALLATETDVEYRLSSAAGIDKDKLLDSLNFGSIVEYPGQGPRILVIDTGIKNSIIRALLERGVHVMRAPAYSNWEPLLASCDGVVLGNGPGSPEHLDSLAMRLKVVLSHQGDGLPVLGICLGHQLLAKAAGGETYKLPFGHRSHNQPVLDLSTRRAYITSQNHGFAVRESSLSSDWVPWFLNLNDATNEGFRHRHKPFMSVQFHPEASAGPRDTMFIFDEFINIVTMCQLRTS